MFEDEEGNDDYFPLVSEHEVIETGPISVDPEITNTTIVHTSIYFSEDKITITDSPW